MDMAAHRQHAGGQPPERDGAEPGGAGEADPVAMARQMASDVTRPQIAAISVLTLLALIAGLLWSAHDGTLTLGVHDGAGP